MYRSLRFISCTFFGEDVQIHTYTVKLVHVLYCSLFMPTVAITIGPCGEKSSDRLLQWKCGSDLNHVDVGNTYLYTCDRRAKGNALNVLQNPNSWDNLEICEVAVYGQGMTKYVNIHTDTLHLILRNVCCMYCYKRQSFRENLIND